MILLEGFCMQILRDLPDMSTTELYIYKYIVQNPKQASEMTIGQLARKANTSTASILRLCRKYGFSGFSEFKYQLKKEISENEADLAGLTSNELTDLRHFFEFTCTSPEFVSSMRAAAELIASKDLLIFAGYGGSNIIAAYGVLIFSYKTMTSFRIEDPNNMHLGHFSDKIANNTCIFLISVSGQSTEIIARVRNYHTSGCKVITLTSDQDSPLAKAADVCIAYELPLIMTEEDNMTSHVPACYIIETLNRMVSEIKRNQ